MASLRRIATSSFLRAADVVVQVFATLWVTPLLVHTLGKDAYGLWVTVITLVSYIDIFDLGLTSAVTRYVSRALGRKSIEDARETVRSAFSILLRIGAGCMVLVALGALLAPAFMRADAQPETTRLLILVLGGALALSFPLRVFTGVLEAFVRYECTTLTSIARTILVTAAMWWVLRTSGQITHVVFVTAGGGLLHRALNYFFARQVFPEMRLLPLGSTPEARAELLSYGGRNFVMKLVDLVRFRIDNLVIASFVGIGVVGVYSVGMSLIRYYREAIECLGGVFLPVFSQSEGAGDRGRLKRQLSAAIKASAALSTFIGAALVLYGDLFIQRWLGAGFHESYSVMLVLAPAFLLAMAQNPGIYLLYGLSKQERLLRLNVIEAVLNLGLSIWLVHPFGILGVAGGTAISLFITKSVLQPWIVCEEAGMPLWEYYFEGLLLPMLLTAAPMALCHAVISPWLRPHYGVLFAAGVAQAVAVAPVAWWLLKGVRGGNDARSLLFFSKATR